MFSEYMKWLIFIIALFYLNTRQAQSVVTGKEFWLPFSIVKLFKADTAVGQIVALFFYSIHFAARHSFRCFLIKELKLLTLKPIHPG